MVRLIFVGLKLFFKNLLPSENKGTRAGCAPPLDPRLRSQRENLKFDSPLHKNGQTTIWLCTGNYVREPYHHAKFHYDAFSGLWPPYTWSCLYSAPFFIFSFVGSSDKLAPRPLNRFWRLIRQMASFRARMCILGVTLMTLSIYEVESPKTVPKSAWLGKTTEPISTKFCTMIKTIRASHGSSRACV